MTDALRSGEQRIGELERGEGQVAVECLEPFGRVARAVLELQHFDVALGLIFGERLFAAETGPVEHFGELDRVLQRQFGARADRKMRGVRGVAEQDQLIVRPAPGDDPAEIEPGRRAAQMPGIGHQRVAVEMLGEDLLAPRDCLVLALLVEAELFPRLGCHLDDEGRKLVVEAIGVGPHPALGQLLEGKRKSVERLVRAEPDIFVAAWLDVDVEMLGIAIADAAVGTVGDDDQIIVRPIGQVGARLMLEMELHAEIARALLEDRQHPLAADADEAVSRRADALAVNMDSDIVPMRELAADCRAADRVVRHQIVDRLVREDDTPAERVVSAVAFEDVDFVAAIADLHRNGEIEPSGSAAYARDLHRPNSIAATPVCRNLPSVCNSFKHETSSSKYPLSRNYSRVSGS